MARHACTRVSYLAKFSACSSAPQTLLTKNCHATSRQAEGITVAVFGKISHFCGAVFASVFVGEGNDGVYCACSRYIFFFRNRSRVKVGWVSGGFLFARRGYGH